MSTYDTTYDPGYTPTEDDIRDYIEDRTKRDHETAHVEKQKRKVSKVSKVSKSQQQSIYQPTTWRIPSNYTAAQLVYAVRHAKSHPHDLYQPAAYGSQRMTAEQYLRWFRARLHAKINRAGENQERPARGRKDGGDGYWSDYERSAYQLAHRVNTPRLIVRVAECPMEFRGRLAHRLCRPEDF